MVIRRNSTAESWTRNHSVDGLCMKKCILKYGERPPSRAAPHLGGLGEIIAAAAAGRLRRVPGLLQGEGGEAPPESIGRPG